MDSLCHSARCCALKHSVRSNLEYMYMQVSLTGMLAVAGIAVGLRMVHGNLDVLRKEDPTSFKQVVITRKMGFPDIIMPGTPCFLSYSA